MSIGFAARDNIFEDAAGPFIELGMSRIRWLVDLVPRRGSVLTLGSLVNTIWMATATPIDGH